MSHKRSTLFCSLVEQAVGEFTEYLDRQLLIETWQSHSSRIPALIKLALLKSVQIWNIWFADREVTSSGTRRPKDPVLSGESLLLDQAPPRQQLARQHFYTGRIKWI